MEATNFIDGLFDVDPELVAISVFLFQLIEQVFYTFLCVDISSDCFCKGQHIWTNLVHPIRVFELALFTNGGVLDLLASSVEQNDALTESSIDTVFENPVELFDVVDSRNKRVCDFFLQNLAFFLERYL